MTFRWEARAIRLLIARELRQRFEARKVFLLRP
jgi:hypothetical protein